MATHARPPAFTGDFGVFAMDGRGVRHETGYSEGVLRELWRKYEPSMPPDPIYKPSRRAAYFYLCFVFIHRAPSPSHSTLLYTPHTGPISERTFYRRIAPRLIALAGIIDEVHWEDRHDQYNHVPWFNFYCVGAVDTFPVVISQPTDSRQARRFYQPKYGSCVMKVQIIIDLNGLIVFASFPHQGITGDANIWRRSRPHFIGLEYVLADGAYGSCAHTLVPYRMNRAGGMGAAEQLVNSLIQLYRARVEHIIGVVTAHAFFRTPARMGLGLIEACIKISVHATAMQLRERHSMIYRYHETVRGPWPHDAPDILGW
jgi:hypothetical protein